MLGRGLSAITRFTVGFIPAVSCAPVLSVAGFSCIPACFPFHCWWLILLPPVPLLGTHQLPVSLLGILPSLSASSLTMLLILDSCDVRMLPD